MRAGVTYLRQDKLEPYLEAVRLAGLEPVAISPRAPRSLAGLQGLVLTGGGDVDPQRFDEQPQPQAKHIDVERDKLEVRLIEEAYANDLPVLAICRGLQMLNVARGGTLVQHIEGHRDVEHPVRIERGSKLAAIVGEDDYTVNSRHHQAAARVAPGLVVTATAPDGIIEALEDPARRFVVAVQWHPEDRINRELRDLRIFQAFAKSIGEQR